MRRLRLLWLAFFAGAGAVLATEEPYTVFRQVTQGFVAFCRPSDVDELQVIGEPRRLSNDEAQKLAALLGAEDTWYERADDGTLRGMISFCIPHYDFKFLLAGKETAATSGGPLVAVRLCTSCRQAAVTADGVGIKFPNMRKPALEALGKMFEEWFPGWAERTARNRSEWLRKGQPRDEAAAAEPAAPHSAAELFRSPENLAIVTAPEKVEVCMLYPRRWRTLSGDSYTLRFDESAYQAPVRDTATRLSMMLAADSSYTWSGEKSACEPIWNARLKFRREAREITADLCFGCNLVRLSRDGAVFAIWDFTPASDGLFEIIQALFPQDLVVREIEEMQKRREQSRESIRKAMEREKAAGAPRP